MLQATRWSIIFLAGCLLAAPAFALDLPEIELHYEKRSSKVVGIVNKAASKSPVVALSRAVSNPKVAESLAVESSDRFLTEKGKLLGINSVAAELRPKGVATSRTKNKVVRYEQLHQGIPVIGSEIVAVLNQNDEVLSVTGRFLENLTLDTKPKVKDNRAVRIALKDMKKRYGWKRSLAIVKRKSRRTCRNRTNPNKCYSRELRKFNRNSGFYPKGRASLAVYDEGFINNQENRDSKLAWRLYLTNDVGQSEEFFVDAKQGAVIFSKEASNHATSRKIYDCSNPKGDNLCWSNLHPGIAGYPTQYDPYTFGRLEGEPVRGPNPVPGELFGSTDVDDLYDLAGVIHAFYEERFLRNGANGVGGIGDGECSTCSGVPLDQTRVSANINGTSTGFCRSGGAKFTYYPYDTSIAFCRGSGTYDLFAHEYAHANARYVSFNSDGTYNSVLQSFTHSAGESGALNESNSDLVAVYFQYYMEGLAQSIDWIVFNGSNLGATRSLSDPPSVINSNGLPHPDNYNSPNFLCDGSDDDGVHHNSTVPSKAAYLASEGGEFNGCSIQGIGIEKVQQIWHEALNTFFTATTTFNQAYFAINQACDSLANPPFTINSVVPPVTITSEDCIEVKKAMQAVEMDQPGGCIGGAPANLDVTPTCAVQEPEFSGDFNGDEVVDLNDYQILRGRWSYPSETAKVLEAPPEADANGDGVVNMLDYNIWQADFLSDNPGVTPPPPPTLMGDYDFDGEIDYDDFLSWQAFFGQTGLGLLPDGNVDGVIDYADLEMWARHHPSGLAGDFNGDSAVDLWDYNQLKKDWGKTEAGLASDVSGDGSVTDDDYAVWLNVYNQTPAPAAPTAPGDCDGNGLVDDNDYLAWKSSFNAVGPDLPCDFNADGVVDAADYTIWRDNKG